MRNKLLALALTAAIAPCAVAQVPPQAGSQIQQIPASPALERKAPEFQVQPQATPTEATPAANEARVTASRLRVSGASAFPETELVNASGFGTGGELTLTQLRAMAGRIADYYHQRGWFVAKAYLPAQEIKDGTVYIAVIEGRYGQVKLDDTAHVNASFANGLLSRTVKPGDPVTIAPLERGLLLLSDLPGVKVRSTLSPGTVVGTSDLSVDMKPDRRITGSVDADNAGNRYTGRNRLGATVGFNELLGFGDEFTLRGMLSADGLGYARAGYQFQVGAMKLGGSYAYMEYELGAEFEDLKADGTAKVGSVFASYPLVRTRKTNLYVQGAFEQRKFHDEVHSVHSVSDKEAKVWLLNLNGDHTDTWGGGGYTHWSMTWSSGDLDIEPQELFTVDQATARTNGRYDKVAVAVTRLQYLTPSLSLYGSFSGQVASQNLDVSEKMELGGPNAVRAYPEGESYGDQGYVATLEGRWSLPKLAERMPGTLSLVAFVDYGDVTLHKDPWAPGSNSRELGAAGLGLNWARENDFIAKLSYAFKTSSADATAAPDADGRFWAQLVKFF